MRRNRGSRFADRADSSCSIFGGGRRMVDDLLAEARECWKRASEERVSVYASDTKNEWRLTASPHKRPPDSIILDSGVKEEILRDAREFLGSKKWYSERGIPFRRGYLLVSYTYACVRAPIVDVVPRLFFWRFEVWSSWIRENLAHSKCRWGTQSGRLCHFALSNRAERQRSARAHLAPSRTLHRTHGRHRRRVPSHTHPGPS